MFRFIAFLFAARDRSQLAVAQDLERRLRTGTDRWRTILANDRMRILCADADANGLDTRVMPDDSGAIFGALFRNREDLLDDAPSPAVQLDVHNGAAITRSQGRWLIDQCWGDYVALLADPQTSCVRILKDPIGNLPCYLATHREVEIVFSCMADCVQLGMRFSADRAYLRRRVLGTAMASDQPTLNGVSSVHRGECVSIVHPGRETRRTREFYWSPRKFARNDEAIEDAEHAARLLPAAARSCTSSWAAGHTDILHRLSGGLDSSIIAGCLAQAPSRPRLTCHTFFNPHGRCDERPWAHLAAAHSGSGHRLCAVTPSDIDLSMILRAPASAEPSSLMSTILRACIERPLALQCNATAVFTGDGGDSAFCTESAGYALQDFLRQRGLRPRAFALAAHVGLHTHRSAWSVLARSLRAHLTGRDPGVRHEAYVSVLQLVAPELRAQFSTDLLCPHPWFADDDALPWSIVLRLGALLGPSDFYHAAVDVTEPSPVVISPLYSQPFTELCLRIPIYTHFEGGRDRGLARRAFAREAPAAIRNRLWKDRAPGFHDELVLRNRRFLLEALRDGLLASEGFLDAGRVEEALSPGAVRTTVSCVEILRHTELEFWARQWMARSVERAAA